MIEQQQPARRGRPPRATDDRRERRRKEGDLEEFDLKLPIPDWVLDKFPSAEYQHRWFRDEPGRLAIMHKQDWDPVEGVDPVPGAQDKFGQPIKHVLMVKYLDWYEADRAKMEDRRKEVVKQMERGNVKGAGDDAGQTLRSEVSYADASNRLG
jgi:hypothetical protein